MILANGIPIPKLGFGTAGLDGDITNLVKTAIRSGWRLIDTAAVYGSEEAIGRALQELLASGEIRREDLFLQTKIDHHKHGYHAAKREFQRALESLQVNYLDLYLIHWPVPRGSEKTYREENIETWQAFEELYRAGRIRAIGVCNFLERHLLQITENCSIVPMVNQLELHPGYQQRGLVRFCRERGIVLEAWSPMGRGILNRPEYCQMAARYGKDIGQLALRWSIESGYIPITRSSTPGRIASNLEVFDFQLTSEDQALIDGLNSSSDHLDIWSYDYQQMY